MLLRQLMGGAFAAVVGAAAALAPAASAQASMTPVPHFAASNVHNVDCAVGAHIGPLGGCILGNDHDDTVVIERRSADAPDSRDDGGCTTKTVKRTDGAGNSETRTKTDC